MLRTYTIEIVADIPDGKELRVDIDLRDRAGRTPRMPGCPPTT